MEYIISSVIGTICAEVLTLPICTIKTIYQTQTYSQTNYQAKPYQIVSNLYQTQGIKGFFQASGPAIASQVLSSSSKYYLYHTIKDLRQTKPDDLISNSLNGALGGIIGSAFSHPFDVWKNHAQRSSKIPFKEGLFLDLVKEPKLCIQTLYSGYSGSIFKNLILYSLLFPVYDFYKINLPNQVIASIATSLTCSIVTQPVDYYKTVLMSGNKFNGWANPYKGFGLMISRSIPHFMISMVVTDLIKSQIII